MWGDISFANKELLWLLLIIPLLVVWYIYWHFKRFPALKTSSLQALDNLPKSNKHLWMHSIFALRLFAFTAIIVALARPQSSSSWKDIKTEGIDIVMSLDISSSMLAKDFKPNRLEAAKDVAIEFIDARPNDRIGLVIFSGESFSQCPLTSDHAIIKNLFAGIRTGMVNDGTAIGNGLATAISRIKESKSKNKVVILITDGVNNQGAIAPLTAAEIAQAFDVRVYTVGVGTRGKALSPVQMYPDGSYQYGYVDVNIDEESLNTIAELTGGKYFRATDNKSLKEIYNEIDRLEKTIFEERNYSDKAEIFLPFVIASTLLLLMEYLLKNTTFKTVA